MDDKARYIARYVGTMGLLGSLHVLFGCLLWLRPLGVVAFFNFFPEYFGWGETWKAGLPWWMPWGTALMFTQAVLFFVAAFFYRNWSYRILLLALHMGLAAFLLWRYQLGPRHFLFLASGALESVLALWVLWINLFLVVKKVFHEPAPAAPLAPQPSPRMPLAPQKINSPT